jgi:hypothetical protein
MNSERHGISIGVERISDEFLLSFRIVGKLTHQDYQKMTPMLDSALEGVKEPKIKAYVDILELEGWELRAAWDDFKLGLKHGREFTRIAVVGNKKWQEVGAKVGSWFISGESQYFEDEDAALSWLLD